MNQRTRRALLAATAVLIGLILMANLWSWGSGPQSRTAPMEREPQYPPVEQQPHTTSALAPVASCPPVSGGGMQHERTVHEVAYDDLWEDTAASLQRMVPGLEIPVDACPGGIPCLKGDVVLLHQGRCGSTVLMSALGYTSEKPSDERFPWTFPLDMAPEPFLPPAGFEWEVSNGGRDEQMSTILKQVTARLDSVRTPDKRLLISLKMRQVDLSGLSTTDFLTVLAAYGFRHLVVIYRNPLRVRISYEAAKLRREHEDPERGSVFHTSSVENINCAQFAFRRDMLHVGSVETGYVEALQHPAFHNRISLAYERDIHEDVNVAAARVLAGLGQELPPAHFSLLPTTDCPVQELLTNYDDLARLVTGTEYEFVLEPERKQVPLDRPEHLVRMCPATPTSLRPSFVQCIDWRPWQLPIG